MKKMINLLFSLLIVSCSASSDQSVVEVIDANKLMALQQEGVMVIDIRTQDEYDQGHIAGVELIDFMADSFEEKMNGQDKSRPVIIHCQSGRRSANAAKKMEAMGFTKVYDYSGGFSEWSAKGLPIEQ